PSSASRAFSLAPRTAFCTRRSRRSSWTSRRRSAGGAWSACSWLSSWWGRPGARPSSVTSRTPSATAPCLPSCVARPPVPPRWRFAWTADGPDQDSSRRRLPHGRRPGPSGRHRLTPTRYTARTRRSRAMRRARALAMVAVIWLTSLAATEPPKTGSPSAGPQEAQVTGVVLDPTTRTPVVLLEGKRDRRPLAMAIGPFEANGIAIALQGVTPPRPLTHDLFLNVLGDLRASLKRIVVTDLRDDVFYAQLHLETGVGQLTIDSRP